MSTVDGEMQLEAPVAGTAGTLKVMELRQYMLHPGRRDDLVALFDRDLLDAQEDCGMVILGQFRDLDHPDRFIWLRGFRDMVDRHRALEAFYGGPVWARHRDEANATMVDSDDVLLLRPMPGTPATYPRRGPVGAADPDRLVVATTWSFPPGADDGPDYLLREVVPAHRRAGGTALGVFVTEPADNTFPRLPVRSGENVVVVLAGHADVGAYEQHARAFMEQPHMRDVVVPTIERMQTRPPLVRRMRPTGRSAM